MNQTLWTDFDPILVQEIKDQLNRAVGAYEKNSHLIREHVNLEDSFTTGGYASRQVLELVQNASDALLKGGTDGKVAIILTNNALYCANEGQDFDVSGVRALSHAYLSEKRGDEIGRFGLGFKSVLAITDNPQIYSRSIAFEFNVERTRQALGKILGANDRVAILRMPWIIESEPEVAKDPILSELSQWATTVIKLPLRENLADLRKQIQKFPNKFLLFANHVSELTLEIRDKTVTNFSRKHKCRSLGNNNFEIVDPEGKLQNWLLVEHMHRPTEAAKQYLSESVVRDEVKIAYAAPLDNFEKRLGEFWAYYPLEVETTTWGIFNAPWAVNDDRTAMLDNLYNEEILDQFVQIFLDCIPRFRTRENPARHLQYMPSRGLELRSYGDRILSERIPREAAKRGVIPDSNGDLRVGSELLVLPLDSTFLWQGRKGADEWHRRWQLASDTPKNVPHWTCYGDPTRLARLKQLFAQEHALMTGEELAKAERLVPVTPLSEWLELLAQCDKTTKHASTALELLDVITDREAMAKGLSAEIIPTNLGWASVSSRDTTFLPSDFVADLGDIRTIDVSYIQQGRTKEILQKRGFRAVDASQVSRLMFRALGTASTGEDWMQAWNSLDDVVASEHKKILTEVSKTKQIHICTVAGTWRPAEESIVVEALGVSLEDPSLVVDVKVCPEPLAAVVGALNAVDREYFVEEELVFSEYLGEARRAFHDVFPEVNGMKLMETSFDRALGLGPIGLYGEFQSNNLSQSSSSWTKLLLKASDKTNVHWNLQSADGRQSIEVDAPHIWAVRKWGYLMTSRGLCQVQNVLAPSLIKYASYFNVALDNEARHLGLPDDLREVPNRLWDDLFSDCPTLNNARPVDSANLPELLETGLSILAGQERWTKNIPAILNGEISSRPARTVYVAVDKIEIEFLSNSGRPYVVAVDDEQRRRLLTKSTMQDASAAVSVEMIVMESSDSELLDDLYPGLRRFASLEVLNTQFQRCSIISRRIVTPDGVTDQPVPSAFVNGVLHVKEEADDTQVLRIVSTELNLDLSASDIEQLLKERDDLNVKELKARCRAAQNDEERLAALATPELLRSRLPKGLLESLAAFGEPITNEIVAKVFLDVYGFGALQQLRGDLVARGLNPPRDWAGSGSAARFVDELGFDQDFAGERSKSLPPSEVVLGKPGLKPLHDYQEAAYLEIRKVLTSTPGNSHKGMVELPTGAGKTRVAVESVVRLFLEGQLSGPVLWIAQSDELCSQAINTWVEVWREFADNRPLTIGRLWSTRDVERPETELAVIIATDAKLHSSVIEDPSYRWLKNVTAVIVDEAHTAGSPRYHKIFQYFGVDTRHHERPLLGLSATPYRGRSEVATAALANRFDSHLINPLGSEPIKALQDRGVLARVEHESLEGSRIEFDEGERKQANEMGMFASSALERLGSDVERTKRLIDHIKERPQDESILVFTASILSAQIVASLLRTQGVRADAISGTTRPAHRRKYIDDFKKGKIQVLVNCDVLLQGFDAPGIQTLYVARPTYSPGRYLQMVGRALRGPKNGGSETCLIVDLKDEVIGVDKDLAYREFETQWNEGK